MGVEKFFISAIVVVAVLAGFSVFIAEAITYSGQTDVPNFEAFNKTAQYADTITNSSYNFKNTIEQSSSQKQDIISNIVNIIVFSGESVTLAIIALLNFIQIGIAIFGDVTGILFIPTIFLGLALTYIIIKFLMDAVRAVKAGDTQ